MPGQSQKVPKNEEFWMNGNFIRARVRVRVRVRARVRVRVRVRVREV